MAHDAPATDWSDRGGETTSRCACSRDRCVVAANEAYDRAVPLGGDRPKFFRGFTRLLASGRRHEHAMRSGRVETSGAIRIEPISKTSNKHRSANGHLHSR